MIFRPKGGEGFRMQQSLWRPFRQLRKSILPDAGALFWEVTCAALCRFMSPKEPLVKDEQRKNKHKPRSAIFVVLLLYF